MIEYFTQKPSSLKIDILNAEAEGEIQSILKKWKNSYYLIGFNRYVLVASLAVGIESEKMLNFLIDKNSPDFKDSHSICTIMNQVIH